MYYITLSTRKLNNLGNQILIPFSVWLVFFLSGNPKNTVFSGQLISLDTLQMVRCAPNTSGCWCVPPTFPPIAYGSGNSQSRQSQRLLIASIGLTFPNFKILTEVAPNSILQCGSRARIQHSGKQLNSHEKSSV